MPSDRDPSWRLRGFARVMRHESTDAETRLWSSLRDRQLGGFKFRRQVPIAGYVVDFYCIERKLVVELDGGQHEDASAVKYDAQRTETLESIGVRVARFSNIDALQSTDIVLSEILRLLDQNEQNPHPNPLPEYRARGQMI